MASPDEPDDKDAGAPGWVVQASENAQAGKEMTSAAMGQRFMVTTLQ
jgi:hypothetical protein